MTLMDVDEVIADPTEEVSEVSQAIINCLGIPNTDHVKSKEQETADLIASGKMTADGQIDKCPEDCDTCSGQGCEDCDGLPNTGYIVWDDESSLDKAMRTIAGFMPLQVPLRHTKDGTICANLDRPEDLPVTKMVTLLSLGRDDKWLKGKVKGVEDDNKENSVYSNQIQEGSATSGEYDQLVYMNNMINTDSDDLGCILYSDLLEALREKVQQIPVAMMLLVLINLAL